MKQREREGEVVDGMGDRGWDEIKVGYVWWTDEPELCHCYLYRPPKKFDYSESQCDDRDAHSTECWK